MTTIEFVKVQRSVSVAMSAIMDELDDMGAAEDAALKSSLGGDFSTWYATQKSNNGGVDLDVSSIETSFAANTPVVSTAAASSIATTSATLNGTVSPKGVTVQVWFQLHTSDSFTSSHDEDTGLVIGASGSGTISSTTITGSNGTNSLTLAISGLASGTTYYFRAVALSETCISATTPCPTDDVVQTETYGATRTFKTLDAAKSNQTITFGSLSDKSYGESVSLSATASSSLTVSFSSSTPDVCTVSGTSVTLINVGTCTIVASQAGDGTRNPAPDVDRSFTVSRKAVAIASGVTASNKEYNASDTATITCSSPALAAGAVEAGDTGDVSISCTSAAGTFSSASVANGKTVTVTGISLTGAKAARYTLTQPSLTANITSRALTITVSDQTKSVGSGTTPTCSVTITSGALQGSDAISGSATCSYPGPTSTAPDTAGTYTITPSAAVFSTGSASNYNITYATGTLTVSAGALPQSISFGALSGKTFGAADFIISATSQTTGSAATGLTVSFSSLTSGICSVGSSSISANVTSATVSISGVGTCTIRASQAGGSSGGNTYSSATNVDQGFAVSAKSITVTADDKSKTAGASDPTFTVAVTGGLVGSDSISGATFTFSGGGYGPSTTPPDNAGSYTNTPSSATFSSGNSSNYTITYAAGTYTINAAGGGGGPTSTVASATTTTVPRRITIAMQLVLSPIRTFRSPLTQKG
jgi:hypothetical protein